MSTEFPYLTTNQTLGAPIYPFIIRQTTYIKAQKEKEGGNVLGLPEYSYQMFPQDRFNTIAVRSTLNKYSTPLSLRTARYFVATNGSACPCSNHV